MTSSAAEVERRRVGDRRRAALVLFRLARVETVLGDVAVDPRNDSVCELVARCERLLDSRSEAGDPVVDSLETSDDDRTPPGEPAWMAVVAAVVSRDRRVARKPCRRRGKRVHRLVEEPDLERPGDEVAPPVPAGEPGAAPGREVHAAPGPQELVGDLAARLSPAHDEHAARGKLLGPAVLVRRQLQLDRGGLRPRHGWTGLLEGAGRDDDVARLELAVAGLDDVAVVPRAERAVRRRAP